MEYWLAYLALGVVSGLMAGLLGVGGGIIIVPILTFLFTSQGMPDAVVVHLALGTSLACIMFTSLSSLRAHHARGGVFWQAVRRISPGIVSGTLAGSWVAAQLSTRFLKIFFVAFLYYVAWQLIVNKRPKPSRQLPGLTGLSVVGFLIGGVSSLVGIGGGSMSVPFLLWCNIPMLTAIGTSAAIGFPIAMAGTVGYMANGLVAGSLPANTLGFIHLPALVGVSLASICTAPLGARIAHSLPVSGIRKIFAAMIIIIGTKMLTGLF